MKRSRWAAHAALLLSLALLQACTILQRVAESDLGIQYATGKFIERSDDWQHRADRVLAVTGDVRVWVDVGAAATVHEIRQVALAHIDLSRLSPADSLLLEALLDEIEAELVARVGDGLIPEDALITVHQVLDSIERGARRYL